VDDAAWAILWLRATRLELVGAGDDDDLVDRCAPEAVEHGGEEDALLRAAEPRRLTGGEN
ncbi:MAG TPA: hypothetical protein VIG93_10525, partial [Gaiellaceae bacterium]